MESFKVDENGYDNFLIAFQVAFSIFFNLNLQFPKKLSITLEMIQRYFLKIHPDAGTKSKKTPRSKQRVINLINSLKKT